MLPSTYPCWRYHATRDAVLVRTRADYDALGPGWADTPAAFPPAPVVPVDSVDPPAAHETPLPTTEEIAADLYRLKADKVVAAINRATCVDILERTRQVEAVHPEHKGGRKSVLRALEARLAELADA